MLFHGISNSDCALDFVQVLVPEMLSEIRQTFGVESMSHTRIFEWHAQFRTCQTSIEDGQHTGRSISSSIPNIAAKLQQLVHEDQH
jgi:hypothetical protein